MTSSDLIKGIYNKLNKYKLVVVLGGFILAGAFYFYAVNKRPLYTAKSTVFPLTAAADNTITNSALSGILGIEGAPKSFSSEAAINIIELSLSRNLHERVASTKLPEFGNRTVTQILVDELNSHKSMFSDTIKIDFDSTSMAVRGSQILKTVSMLK